MAGRTAEPTADAPEIPESVEVQEHKSIVATAKEMLEARMVELQPIVDEANEITIALAAMNGEVVSPTAARPAPRRTRPSGNGDTPRATGSGARFAEFITVIKAHPDGIKVSAISDAMGLSSPNYLYRLRDRAEAEGVIVKDENGALRIAA